MLGGGGGGGSHVAAQLGAALKTSRAHPKHLCHRRLEAFAAGRAGDGSGHGVHRELVVTAGLPAAALDAREEVLEVVNDVCTRLAGVALGLNGVP